MLDVENLRLHYAKTLEHWRQRFDDVAEQRRARCSTRRSCARGGCIWPARRRRSRPARCSCSRSCSRAAAATRFPGRASRLTDRASVDAALRRARRRAAARPARRARGRCVARASTSWCSTARSFPARQGCAGWITPQVIDASSSTSTDYARGRTFQPITGSAPGSSATAASSTPRTDSRSASASGAASSITTCCSAPGARLAPPAPVTSMRRERPRLDRQRRRSARRSLVGAGGHFCPVARQLESRADRTAPLVAAQEVEFPSIAADARGVSRRARDGPSCTSAAICRATAGASARAVT